MKNPTLWRRLQNRVELRVPGFLNVVPPDFVRQLNFQWRDCAGWFREFVDRLLGTRAYLPLYRMSDGEFLFSCGRQLPPLSLLRMYPLAVPKAYVRWALGLDRAKFKSGTPGYGFEIYDRAEWDRIRSDYAERVRNVARQGILAVNLVDQRDGFAREYLRPMCDWYDRNDIHLDSSNYDPFYFVYAFLLGQEGRRLYQGRRILVVTSDQEDKSRRIVSSLTALGAASVAFLPISRDKSMLDHIDISAVGAVDLVLIGAGVGALNILEQVEPLNALSIDAGYVLDCLWRPEYYMGRRVFTQPDTGVAPLCPSRGRQNAS